MIRIAFFSDDRLFCDGVAGIFKSDSGFDVSIAETNRVPLMADFDVAVIDSRLTDALTLCTTILPTRSVLIAAPNDDDWCREALCAGASGILSKTADTQQLIQAVRIVHEGSVWAPRRVMAACIRHLTAASTTRHASSVHVRQQLSRREREIFLRAATGLANKELASELAIGEATVKAHLTRIFQKLGVRGRAELAALYHGVVPTRAARPSPMLSIAPPSVVRRKSNFAAVGGRKK